MTRCFDVPASAAETCFITTADESDRNGTPAKLVFAVSRHSLLVTRVLEMGRIVCRLPLLHHH